MDLGRRGDGRVGGGRHPDSLLPGPRRAKNKKVTRLVEGGVGGQEATPPLPELLLVLVQPCRNCQLDRRSQRSLRPNCHKRSLLPEHQKPSSSQPSPSGQVTNPLPEPPPWPLLTLALFWLRDRILRRSPLRLWPRRALLHARPSFPTPFRPSRGALTGLFAGATLVRRRLEGTLYALGSGSSPHLYPAAIDEHPVRVLQARGADGGEAGGGGEEGCMSSWGRWGKGGFPMVDPCWEEMGGSQGELSREEREWSPEC